MHATSFVHLKHHWNHVQVGSIVGSECTGIAGSEGSTICTTSRMRFTPVNVVFDGLKGLEQSPVVRNALGWYGLLATTGIFRAVCPSHHHGCKHLPRETVVHRNRK
jgi:hypothetical protein